MIWALNSISGRVKCIFYIFSMAVFRPPLWHGLQTAGSNGRAAFCSGSAQWRLKFTYICFP